MSQKGLAPIVIILLIAVALVGYLIYSGKINLPQKQVNQQTAEAPKIDEIEDWKTYTNEKYGYSFQYPQELGLKLGVVGLGGEEDKLETTRSLMLESKIEPPQGLVMFITAGQTSYKTIDEYSNNLGKSKPSSKEPIMIVSKEKTNVAGIEAIKYTKNQPGAGLVLSVDILKNGYLYQFSLNFSDNNSQNLSTFNQILSTFKFLDKNTTDTSNWKTYKSDVGKYLISYPSDWIFRQIGSSSDVYNTNINLQSKDFVVAEPDMGGGYIQGAKAGMRLTIETSLSEKFEGNYPRNYFATQKEITLDGFPATLKTGGKPWQGNQDRVYVYHNGRNYNISLTSPKSQEALFNQILATFKFQ